LPIASGAKMRLIKTMANGKKIGQNFEQQIKKSVPDYALLYRLPDSAQSFGGSQFLRFSNKNPFDYILFNSKTRILYALEMKTVKGKSISFEREKGENSKVIHYHQIKGLNDWNKYDGIICGFVIEFRELETTVFIDIAEFNKIMREIPKKSFNFEDLQNYNYIKIEQTKARTRYTYNIEKFLKECVI